MEHQPNCPSISVIVPCRDHSGELRRCLQGLTEQIISSPYEIIVVDSAADPAVAAVVAAFPTVYLVRSRAGLLPGDARNLGVRHAKSPYLAFIDADCIPEPNWLASALTALNEGAIMVGGPVLDVYLFHAFAVADNLMQFIDFSPRRPDGIATHFPGCNFAATRTAFHELGGFPANVPVGEDVLFTGAIATRWPNSALFVRDMRVRHTGRTNLRAFWQHQEILGFYRSRLGLMLRPIHQSMGRWAIMTIAVVCKRFSYILIRAVQWHPTGLLRLILLWLWPSLLLGLVAFARGFRRGCCEVVKEEGRTL